MQIGYGTWYKQLLEALSHLQLCIIVQGLTITLGLQRALEYYLRHRQLI